jgi:sortase A
VTSPPPLLSQPDAAVRPLRDRRAPLRVAGELLLTLGAVVLLFAAYEILGTEWSAGEAQRGASEELDRLWRAPAPPAAPTGPGVPGATAAGPAPAVGSPELRMYVPALGRGWVRTVLEGVGQDVLARGPGHYPGTALPGSPGNVAIAGHRVGHGAPFDAAADVRSCDAVVLEARTGWFVYRVLPFAGEQSAWSRTAAARPSCRGVAPLAGVPGQEIVPPTGTEVIAPVPGRPGVAASAPLLTITTCNPRFSARQRLVLHAVLVATYPKAQHGPGWRPSELAGV